MELVLAIKGGGGNLIFFQMFPLFHFDIIALHFAKISLRPIENWTHVIISDKNLLNYLTKYTRCPKRYLFKVVKNKGKIY